MEVSQCGGVVSEVGVDASGVVERLRHLWGASEVVDDVEYQAVGGVDDVGLVTGFDSEEIIVVPVIVAECRRVDGSERVDGSLRLGVDAQRQALQPRVGWMLAGASAGNDRNGGDYE
ncbi:hypothetical protein [Paramuribaculum intestinale]|uniref:hypothetical protein n=1 Tax=Paramuribaculum intestinale TaxID=2094151 RepID=UPI001F187B96|nr:hypothetical protein [Paramuribaculum intestinale]